MSLDCLVIGAGIVGLASARAFAEAGLETIIVEKADRIGDGLSSRNSEVIHAGIYYPPGSAKARLCRLGRDRLYAYCADRAIAHRRLGKLIVATAPGQRAALAALAERARANGVEDLAWLEGKDALALEPALTADAALFSPSTGILDAMGLMRSLLGDAERAGAALALRSPFLGAEYRRGRWSATIGGAEPTQIETRFIINAAGLDTHAVARACGIAGTHLPPLQFAKGNYFLLKGQANPFRRLIYPLPEPGGLGIHLTLDLGGAARFGPDVEWVDGIDFSVDAERARFFYPAIRQYFPALADGALEPGYCGIRPKLTGPGAPADFLIQGEGDHGAPGLVNLLGIESPGLTASLAIAETIRDHLLGRRDGMAAPMG